jgi:hypothetical protein
MQYNISICVVIVGAMTMSMAAQIVMKLKTQYIHENAPLCITTIASILVSLELKIE